MHGREDQTVPASQSEIFYDSLLAKGYSAELAVIEEHGHDFIENAAAENDIFIPTLKFINELFNE